MGDYEVLNKQLFGKFLLNDQVIWPFGPVWTLVREASDNLFHHIMASQKCQNWPLQLLAHNAFKKSWCLRTCFFFPLPLHCISSFLICHSTWSPRTGFEMNILKFQPSKLILSRFYSASCLSEIFDSDWSFVAFCTQIFSLCLLLLIPVVWVLV